MKSTKKQIIIVFAILTMALVLSCAFVACDKVEPDKEDVCEHVEVTDNAVEPTCTEKGLTEGTHCSKCGKILQAQNEIPALGHDLEHHDGKEATCTEKGWKEYDTCKREGCDHTTYEEIPALGHTGGTATCTEQATCSVCGEKYGDALGHNYGDIIPKTEPTCSAVGVDAHYKCSVCNKVFKNDEHKTETTLDELTIAINPNAHNFGEWIKNEGADTHTRVCSYNSEHTETENCQGGTATCTEQAVCSVCGEKYGVLAEHKYKDNVCTVCGILRQSEGLTYSLNSDGNGYKVTGIGTCTDKELIIPSEYNAKPVTSIGNEAFSRCTGLMSVTIPDSVKSIGDDAFYNCYRLIEVYNKSTLSITAGSSSNGYVAYYAKNVYTNEGESKLTTDENGYVIYTDGYEKILVAYHGTNTELALPSYITKINQYAFYNCTGLTSITIPDSVTSIGSWAFRGCSSLTSVTIPDSVTSVGSGTFYNCTGLTSVTIPDSVKSIGDNAFEGCTGLMSITIPDSVTSIGSWAFRGCTGLTSVTIPDKVTSIGSGTFSGCTGLTSITIPYRVTSIGSTAFYNCTGLTSVTIGGSVTSIGNNAFFYCTGLTNITFKGTKEQWNAISKDNYWNYSVPATYVDCTDGPISI